ncbi:MAG TPA: protein kinase family protein [Nocardioidaceae bacterium]|nr:protein kinase family protein [Nocardioidaceae bacterium]
MTDKPIGRGTVLAGRFRLEDLVQDTDGARFWRAIDQTLARSVAVNVIDTSDPRSEAVLVAARTSATITEGHFLRVLDAAREDGVVYVVHEWGTGMSLDKILADGPLPPRRAAWLVKEVADAITVAHSHGIAHGRLVPENVMVTEAGSVKLIGFVVDAVLHGRQPATVDGRVLSDHESDVYNLAGLLYATLVGKWPGSQESGLPDAPCDHDRILRPRQVRAGVPRALDTVCDRVLNPTDAIASIETAQEISAALSDFIGEASAAPVGHEPTIAIEQDELSRFRPAAAARRPATGSPADDPEATQAAPSPSVEPEPTARVETPRATDPEATQAAGPLFEDDVPRRRPAPPPPPPLPEPEAKPLFAPGPPRASSHRYDAGADEPSGPVRGIHSTHGTGSLPPVWGPDAAPDEEDESRWGERDSSRDWLRLAGAVGVVVLLVVAIIFAFNLGRGSGDDPSAEATDSASESAEPPKPIRIAAVSDLDPPPAGNGEENPDLAPLAVDGDPSTAWQTMEYYGNPKFGLLKDGVGLVLDLGRQQEVSSVQVTVQGSPTSFQVLAAPEGSSAPTAVGNLRRVAAANDAGGPTDLKLDRPVSTQYLVVWLTSLPPEGGNYRGRIAEIVVKG